MTRAALLPNSNGLARLNQALQAAPILELKFYPTGIVRRLNTPTGISETVVAPEDIARVLAQVQKPITWSTGIIGENTLLIAEQNFGRVIVEYRPPQKTGVWLEGSDDPVRIPMPGLVLFRYIPNENAQRPTYLLVAVKSRPKAMTLPTYGCPLPNTYHDGRICWGTVASPSANNLHPMDLNADWGVLLGSRFGNHSTGGKSKSSPKDIRKLLLKLDADKVTRYPTKDMVATGYTLERHLADMGAAQ